MEPPRERPRGTGAHPALPHLDDRQDLPDGGGDEGLVGPLQRAERQGGLPERDPEPAGELGGDSAPSNLAAALPTLDNAWTLTVDANGDGLPDTGLSAVPPAVPAGADLRLLPNVPNPFNPATEIRFALERAGTVELAVFDARGRRVAAFATKSLTMR